LLLGHKDQAHAAFADLLHELVRADDGAGAFPDRSFLDGHHRALSWWFQKTAGPKVIVDQVFEALSQFPITAACLGKEFAALGIAVDLHGGGQNRVNAVHGRLHGRRPGTVVCYQCVKSSPTGSAKLRKPSASLHVSGRGPCRTATTGRKSSNVWP